MVNTFTSDFANMFATFSNNLFTSDLPNIFINYLVDIATNDLHKMFTSDFILRAIILTSDLGNILTCDLTKHSPIVRLTYSLVAQPTYSLVFRLDVHQIGEYVL